MGYGKGCLFNINKLLNKSEHNVISQTNESQQILT